MNRRQLLRGASALPLLPLASQLAAATAGSAQRLIVIMASGAWDVTYVFDPKDPSEGDVLSYIDGPWRRTQDAPVDTSAERISDGEFGSLKFAYNNSASGRPSVYEFFRDHGEHCVVVNGVSMGSISHDSSRIRILTGTRSSDQPDLGAICGYELQDDAPIGYMDFGGSGFAGPYAASSGKVGNRGQLKLLLDSEAGPLLGPDGSGLEYPLYAPAGASQDAIQAYLTERRALADQRLLTEQDEQLLSDLDISQEGMERLKEEADSISEFISLGAPLGIADQLEIALQMMDEGLCRSVLLNTGLPWDTHEDNFDQNDHFENLFGGLNSLMGSLDLENTMIVLLSEFTRTPKLNGDDGKDHWPVASAMLIGGGVRRGGHTLGATDDSLSALPVDFSTGLPPESGEGKMLTYAELIAGILQCMGIEDTESYLPGVEAFHAIMG